MSKIKKYEVDCHYTSMTWFSVYAPNPEEAKRIARRIYQERHKDKGRLTKVVVAHEIKEQNQ
jgi:ribosomal protein S3AE